MHPLKGSPKIGYRHGQRTFYGTRHLGTDYLVPTGTPLYAPFDGICERHDGKESGTCLWYSYIDKDHGKVICRFMHLSKVVKTGSCKEGDLLGYTGSTGLSTGPHLHLDMSRNQVNIYHFDNFLDPEKINWNPVPTPIRIKVQILFNKTNWEWFGLLGQIQDWFWQASGQRIWLEMYNPLQVDYSEFPSLVHIDVGEARSIEYGWYKRNIWDKCSGMNVSVFVVDNATWTANKMDNGNGFHLQAYTHPLVYEGVQIAAGIDPSEMSFYYPDKTAAYDYIRHELCHAVYKLGSPGGFDLTHKHFYDEHKPENCFTDGFIDYDLLLQKAKDIRIK